MKYRFYKKTCQIILGIMTCFLFVNGMTTNIHAETISYITSDDKSVSISYDLSESALQHSTFNFECDDSVFDLMLWVNETPYQVEGQSIHVPLDKETDNISLSYSKKLVSTSDNDRIIIREDSLDILMQDNLNHINHTSQTLEKIPKKEALDEFLNEDEYIHIDQETGTIEVLKHDNKDVIDSRKTVYNVKTHEKLSFDVNFYWKSNPSFAWQFPGGFSEISVEGLYAFCIEPSILQTASENAYATSFDTIDKIRVMDGRLYTSLSNAQKRRISLIGRYGYGYPGHDSKAYRWATQVLIYEAIGWAFESYGTLDPKKEMAIIETLIDNHDKKPSWNDTVIKVEKGGVVDLSDKSLLNYEVDLSNSIGIQVIEKSGSTLKVKVLEDKSKIVLKQVHSQNDSLSFVYTDGSSQKVGRFTTPESHQISVGFSTVKGIVKIKKYDQDGNTYSNVTFEIKNANHNIIGKITTNNAGEAVLTNLEVGTYYYREISVPKPLLIDSEWKRFEIKNETAVRIDVINDVAKGKIKVVKKDTEGKPIEGVIFEIYQGNKIVSRLITNFEGIAISDDLNLGEYQIKEVFVPSPYILDATPKNLTLDYENDRTPLVIETVEFINKPAKGKITLFKHDLNKDPIANAVFELYDFKDNKRFEIATNDDGIAVFDNLELGSYYLVEKSVPEPYVINKAPYPVTIEYENQNIPIVQQSLEVENQAQRALLKLKKREDSWDQRYPENNNQALSKVEFELIAKEDIYEGKRKVYAANESVGIGITDINGNLEFGNLPLGKYVLKERQAPIGYQILEESLELNLNFLSNSTNPLIAEYSFNIENQIMYGDVCLEKVNNHGKTLEGAIFDLYDVEHRYLGSFTSDESGLICVDNLRYGTYYFIEKQAPVGHILDSKPLFFNISHHKQKVSLTSSNELYTSKIIILKKDGETGLGLKGAGFSIRDLKKDTLLNFETPQGETYSVLESDENGIVEVPANLPYGSYSVEEVYAPEGYIPSNPINFEVNLDAALQSNHEKEGTIYVDIKNYPIRGSLKVVKTDTETGLPIKGVHFEVKNQNSDTTFHTITNEDGIAMLDNLDYGSWAVQEINTVKPYWLSDAIQFFEVKNPNDSTTLYFENERVVGDIDILKIDQDSLIGLKGAQFELYPANGLSQEIFKELYENKNIELFSLGKVTTSSLGEARFENLELGKYFLVETFAPKGYMNDLIIHQVELNYDTQEFKRVSEKVVITNKRRNVLIRLFKVDGLTQLPIHSTLNQFIITDQNGVEYEPIYRGEGVFEWELLDLAVYQLREIKASTGYRLNNKIIEIDLKGDETEREIRFENFPYVMEVLPFTGLINWTYHSFVFVLLGVILRSKKRV